MSEIGASTPSLRSWYFTHVSQIPHVLSKPWFHVGMYEVFKYNLGCGFFSPPLTLHSFTAAQGRMAGSTVAIEMITGRFMQF